MSQEARLTHRQRQALQTRRLIVDAATKLFLERGYGLTTMEAIAAEAGVAVSTVYAIFKKKRAFLGEIRSVLLDQARTREIHEEARKQRDPERRLEMIAHQSRRQWEFGGSMIALHEGAAAVDLGCRGSEGGTGQQEVDHKPVCRGDEGRFAPRLGRAGPQRSCWPSLSRKSIGSWWRSRAGPRTSTKPG
jgi:Bacterial regulatory proteins, tetR family